MYIAEKITYMMQGATLCFFVFALCMLWTAKDKNRLQQLLTAGMWFWVVTSAKDILYMFPAIHDNVFATNVLLWTDMFGIPMCALFLFEAVFPGWVTKSHLVLVFAPHLLFGLAYIIFRNNLLFDVFLGFSLLYGIVVTCITFFNTSRYNRYVHENYSYTEHINLHWIHPVCVLLLISLIIWTITALHITYYGDIFTISPH